GGASGAGGGGGAAGAGGEPKKRLPMFTGPPPPQLIRGVKNTLAVASGKGGVGKSTVAVNLALALQQRGQRVGVMDIDIYGPSLGLLMGVRDRPVAGEDGKIWPLEKHGVSLMSLSFFGEPGEPVIWRGPMVGKLIKQFIDDVNWGTLDYLVVDLPPGTGDAQLALVQDTKVSGAVIVTTPSELALIDARRGHEMFNQVKVPVLGIVENMSYYLCPKCEKRHDIFDHGGGKRAAEAAGVPFLGEIPLDPTVRAAGDGGEPVVVRGPGDPHAAPFFAVADEIIRQTAGAASATVH
ncbi:MAG TPA: Mrp/NBP35 family ATP-binding protein, partial [Myxococcota bacterium]|nr:Mrp/NBP35 family ATP-binding protein [Myxococcota bacterium]